MSTKQAQQVQEVQQDSQMPQIAGFKIEYGQRVTRAQYGVNAALIDFVQQLPVEERGENDWVRISNPETPDGSFDENRLKSLRSAFYQQNMRTKGDGHMITVSTNRVGQDGFVVYVKKVARK